MVSRNCSLMFTGVRSRQPRGERTDGHAYSRLDDGRPHSRCGFSSGSAEWSRRSRRRRRWRGYQSGWSRAKRRSIDAEKTNTLRGMCTISIVRDFSP
eukprot:3808422-Prymnesium_polylepis.1